MGKTLIAREMECKTALNKTGIPGYQYCMNPYVGCTHACIYCYASFMCRFTGHSEPWGEFLDVKVNFPSALGKQLSRSTRPQGKVVIGTVTDAYQPAEARYGLTRACLEILADYKQLEVHILTKSALVQRDTEILKRIPAAQVGFTITTMDSRVARVVEPGASAPSLRLGAARRLREAGLPVWVFIAPLLPGLTDTEPSLYQLWKSLREAGIEEIMVDYLNPYPAVVHRVRAAYRDYFPEALPVLEEYLRHPTAYQEQTDQRIKLISL
ncbi:MAG: radical SAM protein [Syntrophomonadaceae bacterium]